MAEAEAGCALGPAAPAFALSGRSASKAALREPVPCAREAQLERHAGT